MRVYLCIRVYMCVSIYTDNHFSFFIFVLLLLLLVAVAIYLSTRLPIFIHHFSSCLLIAIYLSFALPCRIDLLHHWTFWALQVKKKLNWVICLYFKPAQHVQMYSGHNGLKFAGLLACTASFIGENNFHIIHALFWNKTHKRTCVCVCEITMIFFSLI